MARDLVPTRAQRRRRASQSSGRRATNQPTRTIDPRSIDHLDPLAPIRDHYVTFDTDGYGPETLRPGTDSWAMEIKIERDPHSEYPWEAVQPSLQRFNHTAGPFQLEDFPGTVNIVNDLAESLTPYDGSWHIQFPSPHQRGTEDFPTFSNRLARSCANHPSGAVRLLAFSVWSRSYQAKTREGFNVGPPTVPTFEGYTLDLEVGRVQSWVSEQQGSHSQDLSVERISM